MEQHTTNHLLMIRPVQFGYNAQTAVNNAFQVADHNQQVVQAKARAEFDTFAEKLTKAGVHVLVVEDTPEPHTPDSIFPNNWVSFHADGKVYLYPMYAANRRQERKPGVLAAVHRSFAVMQTVDLTHYEAEERFMEGTGSMVLDRSGKIAYACLSPRTDAGVLEHWCKLAGYKPILFAAKDANGTDIYHTNVLMAVADQYVVICLEAIPTDEERQFVQTTIQQSGKAVVPISLAQMNQFAGNMLQVHNAAGEKILVMSSCAWHSLTSEQQQDLERYNKVLHSPLDTIEKNGGGSARCMMAEIHLPLKKA